MSKFEVGQTIRFIHTQQDFKVAAVLDNKLWAQQIMSDGTLASPLTFEEHMFEEIPEFFEPGKTYRTISNMSWCREFHCVRVDESNPPDDYGPEKIAYGKVYYRDFKDPEQFVWGVRRNFHRKDWAVVE